MESLVLAPGSFWTQHLEVDCSMACGGFEAHHTSQHGPLVGLFFGLLGARIAQDSLVSQAKVLLGELQQQ